jgi:hypothetical protein
MRFSAQSLAAAAALSLVSLIPSALATCTPIAGSAAASDPFWINNAALHSKSKNAYKAGFKVFRNVKTDYGAVGDGVAGASFIKSLPDSACPFSRKD